MIPVIIFGDVMRLIASAKRSRYVEVKLKTSVRPYVFLCVRAHYIPMDTSSGI